MTSKNTRIKHTPEFKAETLKLAEKIGVAATAKQLSLHESQIYAWRKASKKDTNISDRERELATENAKLRIPAGSEQSFRKHLNTCSGII